VIGLPVTLSGRGDPRGALAAAANLAIAHRIFCAQAPWSTAPGWSALVTRRGGGAFAAAPFSSRLPLYCEAWGPILGVRALSVRRDRDASRDGQACQKVPGHVAG